MNLREFCVMEVLNIASTHYAVYAPDVLRPLSPLVYAATAAQVLETLWSDTFFEGKEFEVIKDMTVHQISATLGRLARGYPVRHEPLVARPKGIKNNRTKWCLTKYGAHILCA